MSSQSPNTAPQSSSGGWRWLLLVLPLLLLAYAGLNLINNSTGTDTTDGTTPDKVQATATAVGPAGNISANNRADIEKIVRDYLLNNPEILFEVQTALEVKMQKQQEEKTKAAISKNAKDIYRHANAALGGNPDGDITVVEFFDYNCGYCKRGFTDIAKLIKSDPNVRVVFKEYPILSEDSKKAAMVALAARLQGKYWDVHQTLISARGRATEASALKAAEDAGADMEKLKQDLESDAVKNELERVQELAKTMGINGTPHFLVGDRSIGGAPEDLYEQLAGHIKELRAQGCAYC